MLKYYKIVNRLFMMSLVEIDFCSLCVGFKNIFKLNFLF